MNFIAEFKAEQGVEMFFGRIKSEKMLIRSSAKIKCCISGERVGSKSDALAKLAQIFCVDVDFRSRVEIRRM